MWDGRPQATPPGGRGPSPTGTAGEAAGGGELCPQGPGSLRRAGLSTPFVCTLAGQVLDPPLSLSLLICKVGALLILASLQYEQVTCVVTWYFN